MVIEVLSLTLSQTHTYMYVHHTHPTHTYTPNTHTHTHKLMMGWHNSLLPPQSHNHPSGTCRCTCKILNMEETTVTSQHAHSLATMAAASFLQAFWLSNMCAYNNLGTLRIPSSKLKEHLDQENKWQVWKKSILPHIYVYAWNTCEYTCTCTCRWAVIVP